jgi:hypothetical protein
MIWSIPRLRNSDTTLSGSSPLSPIARSRHLQMTPDSRLQTPDDSPAPQISESIWCTSPSRHRYRTQYPCYVRSTVLYGSAENTSTSTGRITSTAGTCFLATVLKKYRYLNHYYVLLLPTSTYLYFAPALVLNKYRILNTLKIIEVILNTTQHPTTKTTYQVSIEVQVPVVRIDILVLNLSMTSIR